MFPSFPRVCSKDSEGSPGGRGKAPAQLVGQQHLQSPGPSCLTKLFSLNFLLKWVQRTCQRAAIAKLQIQSNPAIFLLSEKPYYLRWKKIPTLQECKCPRGGWCTSAPRAAELTPFCLISYPGRVTLSRGVLVALGKSQQSPLHSANTHPTCSHRSKPKAKTGAARYHPTLVPGFL